MSSWKYWELYMKQRRVFSTVKCRGSVWSRRWEYSLLPTGVFTSITCPPTCFRIVWIYEYFPCRPGMTNIFKISFRLQIFVVSSTSLPQPGLHGSAGGLEVMMGNLEISEVGKCRIFGQWSVDGKLDLLGVHTQTVADVDTDLERHGGDQPVDLRLEV